MRLQGPELKSEFPEQISDPYSLSLPPTDRDEFEQQNQITLDKVSWYRSLRYRMALLMTITALTPFFICHYIAMQMHLVPVYAAIWYLVLIPLLILINWFLAGYIVRPLKGLLQSTTKLANMDLRQRLELAPR